MTNLLTLSGDGISILFLRENAKRSRTRSPGRPSFEHSAVARRSTGSVGGMDLSMVWKVINATVPVRVAYQASMFGM